MARMLIIQQQSAWSGSSAREAQDLSMALAATDHQVTVLYRDAAVLQLLPLSHTLAIKDFTKSQKLFDLYDIDSVCICQQALQKFQLSADQLRIETRVLDQAGQQSLINQADMVVVI